MIDKLLKFLPLGTLIIIFCGFTKLYFYYLFFHLDVTPYLTLADLFNLFLSDSIYIAIILSGPIFHLIKKYELEQEIQEEEIRKDERDKTYKKVINDLEEISKKLHIKEDYVEEQKQSIQKTKKKPIFTIITLFLFIVFLFLIYQKQTILITCSYLSFAAVVPIIFLRSLDNTKFDLGKKFELVSFSISLLFLVFARINLDYFNSINSKYVIQIETLSGEKYESNKSLLRIGNTETYTFLYDTKDSTTLIIRNDNIKKIKSTANISH